MNTLVWAYKPIKELNGETGMVECDEELAAKLIESGDVQDLRVGGLHLKEIQQGEYQTKTMTPTKKAAPKKPTKKAKKK